MSSIFNLFRSSSASDFSLPYARKTADWNIVLWLLVPAWLLFWLWTNPPHGFDLAFEHQFYVKSAALTKSTVSNTALKAKNLTTSRTGS